MDQLDILKSLGLTIPTPTYLVGSIIFSIVGMIAYRLGKKSDAASLKWIGIALTLYPCVIDQTWLLYTIGTGLCLALCFFYFQKR